MPRLLHMADVHLGARHRDLGPAAQQQRERQFAAYRRAIDTAIERDVDAVLICGDLFDSNAQPRQSVQKAATELRRLADRSIPTVIIPGTHDCYNQTSIYRSFDLESLAGLAPGGGGITVLTPQRPDVVLEAADTVVFGRVFETKRAPRSALAGFDASRDHRARYRVGMIHGALIIPGVVESDDVTFTSDEVAASGLHYLALGHWHSFRQGRAGGTAWAYSGAPEPVAVDQDGAGQVLVVELTEPPGGRPPMIEPVVVGRTHFRSIEIDAGAVHSAAELQRQLQESADPDTVLEVRVSGIAGEGVEIRADEIEHDLAPFFLGVRVRDTSIAALPEGPLAPTDTIAGAFARDVRTRIEQAEAAGDTQAAGELREVLRLGHVLLDQPTHVSLV